MQILNSHKNRIGDVFINYETKIKSRIRIWCVTYGGRKTTDEGI